MKEELTEKMHSEFSVSRETDILFKVSSAIHNAIIMGTKRRSEFESILKDHSVTYDDYEKWKKHYEELALKLKLKHAPTDFNNQDEHIGKATEISSAPLVYKEKKRILYKECKIAGITFRNMGDLWDELYEGGELVLIRHKNNKYDKYAIAVGWADDYGYPYGIDWDNIIGYIPRAENQHIATMMDLGWGDAFECELSKKNGSDPYKGSLSMKIYVVSKEEPVAVDTSNLLRVLELDNDEYKSFTANIATKGCTYFRWGEHPYHEYNLPQKGENIVLMYKCDGKTILYLMHCIAVGDYDASFFVEDNDTLFATDNRCYYVFTLCKGPIIVENEKIDFLADEKINKRQAGIFLNEADSSTLKELFDIC